MFMANGPKLKELEQTSTPRSVMPPRNDVQKRHANIYAEVPVQVLAEVPGNYELYPYPRLSVTDEAFTCWPSDWRRRTRSMLDNRPGLPR
jgi:hypothetical protein